MSSRRIGRYSFLLLAGLGLGAIIFGGENFLERLSIDLRFFIVSSLNVQETASDQIAIIKIDLRSETALMLPFGTKWRQLYPSLLQKLNEAGASLIVFDSMFLEQEGQWDRALAAALARAGNVMAGEDGTRPTQEALRGSFLALGNLSIRPLGGKPRFVRVGALSPPSLAPLSVVAAEEFAKRAGTAAPDIRGFRGAGFWINYREPPGYFPSFSFADVLHAEGGRLGDGARTPMSVFTDRIVFIGLDDTTSRSDRFVFPNTWGRDYPGVYAHAYATDTILRGRPVVRVSPWIDAGITLAFLLVLLFILEIRARKTRTLLLVTLPLAVFLFEAALLSGFNLWPGFAPVFVAFWVVLVLHWVLLRISLVTSLSRAMGFDSRLIDAFRREGARAGGPVRKEVAILIADIRNYTRYVSRTDPVAVSRVMTEYMESMERCITAQGGYINKYVGDEIIAVFGFPLAAEQCAERAVRAAIAMQDDLSRLVASWKERGLPHIERIGIGIDKGAVVFAEVGGRTKSQFDIIGDCINGASRIEHLTKELHRVLLISEEAYDALESDDSLSGSFELVKSVVVRGQGERKIFGLVR
jgi:class 3 adenylate cyclase/CHASE2 domain-containing sensor protein